MARISISIIWVILILNSNSICAQQQMVHKKKIYASQDGKLYYNKALPVYFWISTSSDKNSEKHLLPSESTPQYANPMYFDTEGRNTLRSPSAVDTVTKQIVMPEIDVQFQIYVDGISPTTSFKLSSELRKNINDTIFVKDSVSLYLSAIDALSGTENIYYSINNSNYATYKNAIRFDTENYFLVEYYAVDNTGNVEQINKINIKIDKSAPLSKLSFEGDKYNEIFASNGTISIHGGDNISGINRIFYAIDDTIFRPYQYKLQTQRFTEGEHTLKYYAEDNVGNKEAIQSYAFYADFSPPQVIEEIQGKTFIANGREFSAGTSHLKISSFDNKAGVKEIFYSINNSAFEKYEKPVALSGFKGNVIIRSYAVDNVGNASENKISNNKKNTLSYVDLGEPWVGYRLIGPIFKSRDTTFINQKTQIELNAKDTESGIQKIEYQLDSNNIAMYSKPFNLEKEGPHRITVFGYDNTDNLTRQEFHVCVDTVGPQIFERFSASILNTVDEDGIKVPVYPNYVVLFLSATDISVGYENLTFKLNNFPEQQYLRDIRGFDTKKKNIVTVKAVDKLGNISFKKLEFYAK